VLTDTALPWKTMEDIAESADSKLK